MYLLNKSVTSVVVATIALLGTTIVASEKSLAANLRSAEVPLDRIIDESYSVFDAEVFELPSQDIKFELLAEFAGNANKNSFGIYDVTDKTKSLAIFNGLAKVGAKTTLKISGNTITTDKGSLTLQGETFGFYIDVPGPMFYSDSSLNPRGSNQSHTYRNGNDGILAFEDEALWMSDSDYNDMVILASGLWDPELSEEIAEVPEPSTLLGLGLLISTLAASCRRQQKSEV
jgi:hypothetical protein